MVEKKTKTAETVKKPVAGKKAETSKKAILKVAPVKKVKKSLATGLPITVVQIASPIGREQSQRATLIGLGLNKIRRSKILVDTPDVRGMIEKVKHLVKIVG